MKNQSDQIYQIRNFMDRRIGQLINIPGQDMPGQSSQKAMLANLRRGVGKKPGELPDVLGILLQEMPEELLGQGGEVSRSEWACYTALTLFALHQQGRDPHHEPMTQKGEKLGKALQRLASIDGEDSLEPIRRRFNMVATASDIQELSWHLRGVVQLLRAKGIPLDYPALAEDLYWYQFPDRAADIRLSWGRDFYHVRKEDGKEDS